MGWSDGYSLPSRVRQALRRSSRSREMGSLPRDTCHGRDLTRCKRWSCMELDRWIRHRHATRHEVRFRVIMTNFNHERIGIIIQCLRFSRVCYEESMKYAHKRRTFGQKLINHAVIRMKLAHMARQIEASYSWMESLIFQCQKMSDYEAMLKLGGAIAGLKAQATVTFEFCAREASQIFGGLSYSRGGQGAKVERLYRDVR